MKTQELDALQQRLWTFLFQ